MCLWSLGALLHDIVVFRFEKQTPIIEQIWKYLRGGPEALFVHGDAYVVVGPSSEQNQVFLP